MAEISDRQSEIDDADYWAQLEAEIEKDTIWYEKYADPNTNYYGDDAK